MKPIKINKYTGVVAIVYLDEEPKRFAVSQTNRGYSLPGGSIEDNDESLESAMYRELKEELSLLPNDVEMMKTDIDEIFVYDSKKQGRENQQTVRAVFIVKSHKKELQSNDDEVINAKWYSYDEAMDILTWPNANQTLKKGLGLID